ncbi:MAG TPA: trypsin-like peptidase domain-containing protein [Bdellovibrionota bacterium]|nr:trypsin-like peptidase domain-containing protein [Bdellovibrionota bacterium]
MTHPILMIGAISLLFASFAGAPAFAQQQTPADPNIFVNLAKKSIPSVVNISSTTVMKGPFFPGGPEDFFRKFFGDLFGPGSPFGDGSGNRDQAPERPDGNGPAGPKQMPRAISLGTGFIIDKSGLILTNNHVVEGAEEIRIAFTEERGETPTIGKVVGRDPELDVALIRVNTERTLLPLALGDSDALQVGEYVMAIGNPFGQGHSVTHGIISAKQRPLPDFTLSTYLQTDAPINPGNSGGPLVNQKGEVIGINNAIEARAQGIGFAIPVNAVKMILTQLRTKGVVSRGYIGALVGELTPEVAAQLNVPKDLKAPFITNVPTGQPADKAGLKAYDVVTEFNGKKVESGTDLVAAVTALPVGESVPIKVLRNGKEMTFNIKIGRRPVGGRGKATPSNEPKQRPKANIGMEIQTLTPDLAAQLGLPANSTGVVVTAINLGGPADRSGLSRGDVILEVDQKPVANVDEFYSMIKKKKSHLLRVRRSGQSGQDIFAVIVLNLS